MTRVVVASVGRHGHFAEALRVADRAVTLESGAAGTQNHIASSAVLTFFASRCARILVLTVFADEIRWTTAKKLVFEELNNRFYKPKRYVQ